MKHLKALSFTLIALITIAASCNKNEYPEPGPDDFYFRCKIDGRIYVPNSCANCLSFMLLEDTSLIANGNAGFETIGFGINDKTGIQAKTYELINQIGNRATYKYSTTTDDYYRTQNFNPGSFKVIEVDKSKRIIRGTFHFVAYHSFRPNDSVIVSDGMFRVKYTID